MFILNLVKLIQMVRKLKGRTHIHRQHSDLTGLLFSLMKGKYSENGKQKTRLWGCKLKQIVPEQILAMVFHDMVMNFWFLNQQGISASNE